MPNVLRAVAFDAVGTLIHAEPTVARVYAEVGRRHGNERDGAIIEARFRAAFQRQEFIDRDRNWVTSEDREAQRWRDIIAEVFIGGDVRVCFTNLYEHFAKPSAWRVQA